MTRLVALLLLVVLTVPAAAEDPVFDPASRADVAASLAEALEDQGICYGYLLDVTDDSSGGWDGRWLVTSLGEDADITNDSRCPRWVELSAAIDYTSSSSESEDSASWTVLGNFPGIPTTDQLAALDLHAGDLADDGRAFTTMSNAVLALPVLAAENGVARPVEIDASPSPPPSDAAATGRPGSDWWRENGLKVGVLVVLLVLAGLWASITTPNGWRRARVVADLLDD